MKQGTRAACLLCVVAMLLAPLAHAQSVEAAATAHRLMIRSGLPVQLRGFTLQIEREIRQNAVKLDDKMVAALVGAAREAFRPEALQQDMTVRAAKKLTLSDMRSALAWLESESGQRLTRAEEQASVAVDEQQLREYAERLKAKPLGAKRQKLISDLISASSAVRAYMATQEAIALGVAIGMDSLQPRERRIGEAKLRARLREAMPAEKLQAVLAQQLPIVFAYMYRDIAEPELSAYLGFLKSVAGKRYQDGMNAAFVEVLGRASVEMGELAGQRQTTM